MTDETYEGWSNRETWCTALWMDNDELMWTDSRRVVTDGGTAKDLEDWFSDLTEPMEVMDPVESGMREGERFVAFLPETWHMLSDIGSLWRVDWQEIHDHLSAE